MFETRPSLAYAAPRRKASWPTERRMTASMSTGRNSSSTARG